MEISAETVNVLKNFSGINGNIVIRPGNKIMTISEAKNILAEAEVKETFDIPEGTEIISTEGMSVLPGLWDMHVHLMINGHIYNLCRNCLNFSLYHVLLITEDHLMRNAFYL